MTFFIRLTFGWTWLYPAIARVELKSLKIESIETNLLGEIYNRKTQLEFEYKIKIGKKLCKY